MLWFGICGDDPLIEYADYRHCAGEGWSLEKRFYSEFGYKSLDVQDHLMYCTLYSHQIAIVYDSYYNGWDIHL